MNPINRRRFLRGFGGIAAGLSAVRTDLRRPLLLDSRFDSGHPKPSENLINRLNSIQPNHPSLHFNYEDIKELRRRIVGTHNRYGKLLYQWADRNRTFVLSDTRDPEQIGTFVTNFALAYVLSRDDEYLRISRRLIMDMCEYYKDKRLTYGYGSYAAGMARAYDWLYNHDDEVPWLLACSHSMGIQ